MENLVLVMKESASDLLSVYQTLIVTTPQLMEAMHLELIRIMTLYITGYDAPFLKTGIREAASSLATMDSVLDIYCIRFDMEGSGAGNIIEKDRTVFKGKQFVRFI